MKDTLPTARELEQLPLRAVVAYAARTVRRLRGELQFEIPADVIDDFFVRIDTVCRTCSLDEVDGSALLLSAAKVADELTHIEDSKKKIIALSFVHVAMAAHMALEAFNDPTRLRRCMTYAVNEAERAVCAVEVLDKNAAILAADAARSDYATLLSRYGDQHEVIVGDPVDCFD